MALPFEAKQTMEMHIRIVMCFEQQVRLARPDAAGLFALHVNQGSGSAVVYFVIERAKCDDAPPTDGCSTSTFMRKRS